VARLMQQPSARAPALDPRDAMLIELVKANRAPETLTVKDLITMLPGLMQAFKSMAPPEGPDQLLDTYAKVKRIEGGRADAEAGGGSEVELVKAFLDSRVADVLAERLLTPGQASPPPRKPVPNAAVRPAIPPAPQPAAAPAPTQETPST